MILNPGSGVGKQIEHAPFSLRTLFSEERIIKILPYLSPAGYINLIYKEVKSTNGESGDDNRFNIVNNQSTVTDTNGETVIVGQKRVALPYHFYGDLY